MSLPVDACTCCMLQGSQARLVRWPADLQGPKAYSLWSQVFLVDSGSV